jgi:hypothetical protein
MTMTERIKALLKRAERAERKRAMFAALMQDCYAFAMPERDGWTAYGYGQERNQVVYDSTAVVACARFANRLQQALFPPQQRWSRLSLPPDMAGAEAATEVQQDLEAATDIVFRHVHASNFDQAANEWAQDLAAGVGCLLVEDGRMGGRRPRGPRLRFQAVPSAMVAFDDGPHGTVEGVFYSQRMPARLLRRTYPDATNLPQSLAAAVDRDDDEDITLLQATTYDAERDGWAFEVLHKDEEARLVERRYRTCPWIVTRWTRAPGETHGRGPLTQALPDIRTLNKLRELMLKAASLGVGGVWTALDDGVLNPDTVRIEPGAIIPVRSNGGPAGPSLRPLDFPGAPQLSEVLQDQLRTSIRQVLFDDPLPPEIQAGVTATEIIERIRRFQADTGAFGRLQADAVTPLIVRIVDILEQAGEFAAPQFQGLMDLLRNDAVRVVATSPLAQAQDRADVQGLMSTLQALASLGEVGAAMTRKLDLDKAGEFVLQKAGVPQTLIKSDEQLAAEDEQRAQQAEAQMIATSPVAAQVAGAVANAATQAPEEAA